METNSEAARIVAGTGAKKVSTGAENPDRDSRLAHFSNSSRRGSVGLSENRPLAGQGTLNGISVDKLWSAAGRWLRHGRGNMGAAHSPTHEHLRRSQPAAVFSA
jgi:hypothetical protein